MRGPPISAVVVPSSRKISIDQVLQRPLLVMLVGASVTATPQAWPATIEQLGLPAEQPADACSGQPLRLRSEDGCFSIYACGLDGDDDNGRALAPPNQRGGDGDIVKRVRLTPGRMEQP